MDYKQTKMVLASLEQEKVRYVIIGGVALTILGLPRATQDLDLFIAPDGENIARLRKALHRVFDDPSIEEISAEDLLGEYPAVQYVPPSGTFTIDILTRLGETFRFDDLQSQRIDFDDLTISVVTPSTLYRMKKGTVRPRDWDDAASLKRRFKIKED